MIKIIGDITNSNTNNNSIPLVYIIIPVHNRWEETKNCLDSLRNINYRNYKVFVINDGSIDNTSKNLKKLFPKVIELKGNGSLWWSGAINKGIKYILKINLNPDYILTLNNDVLLSPNFLDNLINFTNSHSKVILGSNILYANDRNKIWQYGTGFKSNTGIYRQYENEYNNKNIDKFIKTETITGVSVLVPFELFKKYKILYDEKYFPMSFGDTDFVLRAKKYGYSAFCIKNSKVYIFNGCTLPKKYQYRNLNFLQFIKYLNSPKFYRHPKRAARFYFRHFGFITSVKLTLISSKKFCKLLLKHFLIRTFHFKYLINRPS